MGTLRARSVEEQNERYQKILATAADFFTTIDYEDISLSKIAKKIGLSRPALYSYFDSKEMLFLTLSKQQYLLVRDKLIKDFSTEKMSKKDFCFNLAKLFFDTPDFLKYQALHQTVMENKIGYDEMYKFKKGTKPFFKTLQDIVHFQFPTLTESAVAIFVQQVTVLLPTMYNYDHIPSEQAKVMNELQIFGKNPPAEPIEFYSEFFIKLLS